MIEFITYQDKWHQSITRFRDKVCVEYGAKDSSSELTHSQLMREFDYSDFAEEIYKFSNAKWRQTEFENIEGLLLDGELVAISGSQNYEHCTRILMHRYTLNEFRKDIPDFTWHKDGFIDRHLRLAESKYKKAIFFTIYPHNKTLETFVNYLKQKKINSNKPLLGKFESLSSSILFKGVEQQVFYYLLDDSFIFEERILEHERN
jgi:hypothetical protein